MWTKFAVAACLALIAGCGGVHVKPTLTLPTPLVEKMPASVGVFYPEEFRQRTHNEERRGIKFSVMLGNASVSSMDRLLSVLFDRVVPLADRGDAHNTTPPLTLAIVPWLDEYSFLTPQEMASREYSVTIRYRFELLDPKGQTVDQLTLTGFGTAPMAKLSASTPLTVATQLALRDLAAKFILDFPQQESVQRLLRGETLAPLSSEPQDVNATLGVFGAPAPGSESGAAAASDKESAPAEPPPAGSTPAGPAASPPAPSSAPPANPEPADSPEATTPSDAGAADPATSIPPATEPPPPPAAPLPPP